MKSEKEIRNELKEMQKTLKGEIRDKDWINISDTALIITWLEWVLKDDEE